MQFSDYLRAVRRYWTTIAATVVVFVLMGVGIVFVSPTTYSATAELFVAPGSSPSSNELIEGSGFFQDRVKTYALIVDSEIVLQSVISDLALADTTDELADRVSASAPIDTVILRITATDPTAEGAAAIANAVASRFTAVALDLESVGDGLEDSIVNISIVESAEIPTSPVSPNRPVILVLAILLGLIAGVVIAVIRDVVDDHLRTEDDVRRLTDVPIMGRIPVYRNGHAPSAWTARTGEPHFEALRQLRTNLQSGTGGGRHRTFVVTSPLRSEGKTTIAVGLSLALADAGHRVCLVDADLRRPKVAEVLELDNSLGLSTVLDRTTLVDDAIQTWNDSDLRVITSGPIPPNPSELVASKTAADLIATLEDHFDFVIIDSPAVLGASDATAIVGTDNAVIMVVAQQGSKSVTDDQLGTALEIIDATDADIWGLVLNMQTDSVRSSSAVVYD